MKTAANRAIHGAKTDNAHPNDLLDKSMPHANKRSRSKQKRNRRENKEKMKKGKYCKTKTTTFHLQDAKTDSAGPENDARKRIKDESVRVASKPIARKQSRNQQLNRAKQEKKREPLVRNRVGHNKYIRHNIIDPEGHERPDFTVKLNGTKHTPKTVGLDLFKIVDSTWEDDMVIYGREVPNDPNSALTFVCVKAAGRRIANLRLDWEKGYRSCSEILDRESNVKRGKEKRVDGEKYVCLGTRPNRKGKGVDMYSIHYEDSQKQGNVSELCQKIGGLVESMENIAMGMLPEEHVVHHQQVFQSREYGVQSFVSAVGNGCSLQNGFCMAVAMARDYRSTAHIDDDCFFSTITAWRDKQKPNVRSKDKEAAVPVLQYFFFTDWMVAVPLREADLLVFNPLTPHGSTNPRHDDASLMSMYVSTRTILAADAIRNSY